MAWETGTAADHVDLFNKIRDFLTTNSELVTAGQNWTQELGSTGVLTSDNEITLRGPGLAGADNIYCRLAVSESPESDIYNLRLYGHAGFSPTLPVADQPLMSPVQYVFAWNQPLTYWIIANGRRWMLVVKVATVYSTAYCGFMLPYATPSEYPFPMVVAGMSGSFRRWSSENQRDRFFASPGFGAFWTYYPDNTWRSIANYSNYNDFTYRPLPGSSITYGAREGYIFPTRAYDNSGFSSPDDEDMTYYANKCFDGSYLMRDLTVVSTKNDGPYNTMMGVLDGTYWVPGRENSSENIITKGGVDHLVVQNLFRNGFRDYLTMRLQ